MPTILEFRDNGTAHDDVFLSLGDLVKTGDAYYLALDYSTGRDDESPAKIYLVLEKLLEQWRVAVRDVNDGSSVFLPYNFSDQYTGCLRCTRDGSDMIVTDGWCDIEGWSVSPSRLGDYLTTTTSFKPGEEGDFRTPLATLVEQINQAIEVARTNRATSSAHQSTSRSESKSE